MWIDVLLRKRNAQVSTVAVIDSEDPKRLNQLLTALEAANYKVLIWSVRGLFNVKDGKRGSEVNSDFGSMALEEALRYVDRLFRSSEGVAFVVIPAGRSETLSAFLREWALDYEIYERDSLVVVFGNKHLVSEEALKNAISIDVPTSTADERRKLAESVAADLGVHLDDHAVDMGAGLTLHEFESALLESASLQGKITADHVAAVKVDIVRRTGILEIEQPEFGFERIGGYWRIKEFLKLNVVKVFEEAEKAAKLGLRAPRGYFSSVQEVLERLSLLELWRRSSDCPSFD